MQHAARILKKAVLLYLNKIQDPEYYSKMDREGQGKYFYLPTQISIFIGKEGVVSFDFINGYSMQNSRKRFVCL